MSYTGKKAGIKTGTRKCKRCGAEVPETVYHAMPDVTLLHYACPQCCDSGVRGIPPGDCVFTYDEEKAPIPPKTPRCTQCGLTFIWMVTADSRDEDEKFPRCSMDCPRPLTGTIPPDGTIMPILEEKIRSITDNWKWRVICKHCKKPLSISWKDSITIQRRRRDLVP